MADEIFDTEDIYTLTDEDGNENDFELIGTVEVEGVTYYALIPYTEDEDADVEEYIVLRVEKSEENPEEEILVSIDDDDEFDDAADYFDDLFSEEIDYDADSQN